MRKVLTVFGTRYASSYYRLGLPAGVLMDRKLPVDTVQLFDIDPIELIAAKPDMIGNNVNVAVPLLEYDVIIFQLVFSDRVAYVMEMLKLKGKKVVLEIDDDYFSIPQSNPSSISLHPNIKLTPIKDGEYSATRYKTKVNFQMDYFRKALRIADALQVSTPELADVYKPYNDNILVYENCVDNSIYDNVNKRVNDVPVLGWFGTRTHVEDLRIVVGCLPENVKLLIAGFPEVREEIFKNLEDVEVIPPYDVSEVPNIVAKCDIGMVPLVDCRFNDGKSDLKGVEFGAGKVPVVASPVAPYKRWIRHEENGFLAKKNRAKFWIRYLQRLADDVELRKSLGEEAKKDAIKRDVHNSIDIWMDAYLHGKLFN